MRYLLSTIMLLFSFNFLFAQNNSGSVLLKSGEINLKQSFNILSNSEEIVNENYYRFLQFSSMPSEEQKDVLKRKGIEFLEYIPYNTYVVSITNDFNDIDKLREFGAISLQSVLPNQKIDPKLQNGKCPDWALEDNIASIKVLFYKNSNLDIILTDLGNKDFKILETNFTSKSVVLQIALTRLIEVSKLSYVSFIEPIDPPSLPENKTGRTLHRSNTINVDYPNGRNYNGSGINVMMQDDGVIGPHIDYQGRIDQSNVSSNGGSHGDHVAGIIMGAGNLDPIAKGMADGAELFVYSSSNNNYYDVPTIYQNNDVTITSKSYGNGCNAGYTSLSRDLDEQIRLYPSLMHVFSTGNSGSSDCGYGAGSGWGNVTGGHKQGKNVLAVANLSLTGSLASSSSRGPAHDGRIKPDIGAKGSSVNSTVSTNSYASYSGTSMACPGISGVLAQLYQAYKELNNGQNPSSALMKCVLLNSADDLGNSGPDFKHGWGEVNAYRAVKILENNQYFTSAVSQSGNISHNIVVPSGTKEIKVMVYWHDKEASANASIALVNDINISLTSTSAIAYNPWVLDYTPNATNLNQVATRGIDDRNNMEQVTISNPATGNYVLNINGFSIAYGPQDYWVSYEFITDDVQLTYPMGGESMVPGESEYIRWDAYENSGNFTLQYTINGGSSWNNISSNVSGSSRYYVWSVPNNITDNAMIRISRNGYSDQSDESFTIINVPQNVSVNWICPDSIYVSWSAVSGATSYEVSMLGDKYMDSMTTTNNMTALIINPSPSITDSWFSVCAKVNGGKGRRAVAVNAQPFNPGCFGYGCTDPTALNYDPNAIYDNGNCCYLSGCLDATACNYDANACFDDNSCLYYGCTDPNATNYDPSASCDDGSCCFGGAQLLIDITTDNYPSETSWELVAQSSGAVVASINAGDLTSTGTDYSWSICVNNNECYDFIINDTYGDGICCSYGTGSYTLTYAGSVIASGGSFGSSQTTSNIVCDSVVSGCTDPNATNYDPNATTDDGSCMYSCNTAPYCQSFDSGSPGDWNNNGWALNSGGTPSTNTGPSDDITGGGNYMYYETSSGYSPVVTLTTCVDISLLSSPSLAFNYHMYGATIGTLDILVDGNNVWSLSGDQGNQWNFTQIDLTSYTGSITIDFVGTYGGSYTGDIAIDEVCVDEYLIIDGCTDPNALNYDPAATNDDGSCVYCTDNNVDIVVAGGTWQSEVSWTLLASDGTVMATGGAPYAGTLCLPDDCYTVDMLDSYGDGWNGNTFDASVSGVSIGNGTLTAGSSGSFDFGLGVSCSDTLYGCTDSTAFNYDPLANTDDGSCQPFVYGCTDATAMNYNANVNTDDGSCIYASDFGCTDPAASNYDPLATVDDGSCTYSSVCSESPITGLFIDGIIDDRVNANFDNMNTYDANGNQICRVDQIRIQYRAVGTSAWSQKNIASPVGYDAVTGICNSTQATMKPIRNLTLATTYEWIVKVWYCSGGNGGWVDGPNFTTTDECPNVGNLTAYGSTPTRATFDWDNSNGSYEFARIKMRIDTLSNPMGTDWFLVGGSGVPYGTYTKNKNGLIPGQTYRGQARTWCDPNGGAYNSLSWTPIVTWTQPANRIEGGESITNLDIYPNPSRDVFNISFTSEYIQDLRVRVMNVVGEELIVEDLQQFVGEYTKQITLGDNAKGIYFLEIETNERVINKKLILQ